MLLFGIHDEMVSCKKHCTFQNRESKIFPSPILKLFWTIFFFPKCSSWITLMFSLLSVFPVFSLLYVRLKGAKNLYWYFLLQIFSYFHLFNVMNSSKDYVWEHIYRQKILVEMYHTDLPRKENEKMNLML